MNDQGLEVTIACVEEPTLTSYYAAGGNSTKQETKTFVNNALTLFASPEYTENTNTTAMESGRELTMKPRVGQLVKAAEDICALKVNIIIICNAYITNT